MGVQTALDLTDHFLIAMPGMMDDAFNQSLIYICEHNEQGALGLVINKPVDITLQQLFEKIDLVLPDAQQHEASSVYYGGPVQTERGFVLHGVSKDDAGEGGKQKLPAKQMQMHFTATLQVTGELEMTSSKDVLEAIAAGKGPEHFLVVLGYSGWDSGQLEQELAQNSWLTVKANSEIIFKAPVRERYNRALALLGASPQTLVSSPGHA